MALDTSSNKARRAGGRSSSTQVSKNTTVDPVITKSSSDVNGAKETSNQTYPKVHDVHDVHILGTVIMPQKIMLETVYDPESETASLVIARPGSEIQIASKYQHNSKTYLPLVDNAVEKFRVLLPSYWADTEESSVRLLGDVKLFINKNADLEQGFLDISARYVLLSWMLDRFRKVPYLRIIGTWGSGKSRFLDVMNSVCRHSTNLGAAVTPANIYRCLDLYQGTQIMDEADFKDNPSYGMIQQILISGNDKYGCVNRTDYKGTEQRPNSFGTFSAKILASHMPFNDDTLESRFLSSTSFPTKRKDIPLNIPDYAEWSEATELRNRLLRFRIKKMWDIDTSLQADGLQEYDSRTIEIVSPLLQVTQETKLPESMKAFLDDRNVEQQAHMETGNDGYAAKAVIQCYTNGNKQPMVGEIRERVNQLRSQGQYPLSDRAVGGIIKGLGLSKRRNNKGFYVECQEDYLKLLAKRYGITYPNP